MKFYSLTKSAVIGIGVFASSGEARDDGATLDIQSKAASSNTILVEEMDVYASPDGEVQKVVMGGFSNPDTFTAAEGNFDAFLGLPVAATAASDMEEMSVPEAEEIVALTSFGAHYSSNTNNEDFNAATPQCGAGGSCQSGSPTQCIISGFPHCVDQCCETYLASAKTSKASDKAGKVALATNGLWDGNGKSGKSTMMCSIDILIGTSHNVVGNFIIGGAWTIIESIVNVKSPSGISGTGEGVVDLEVCSLAADVGALGAIQTGPANKDGIFPIAIVHEEGVAGIGEYNCETGKSYVGSWLVPGTIKGMISATPLTCPSTALEPVFSAPSDFSPLFANNTCDDCGYAHSSPGCSNTECAAQICANNYTAFCCTEAWNTTCAHAAFTSSNDTYPACQVCNSASILMGCTILHHLFTILLLGIGWVLF